MEHVNNHLKVIQHDPLARRKAVNRSGGDFVVLFQSRFDLTGNCLEMRFGRSRTNYKKIGKGRDVAEVENDDVFRFLIRRELGAGFR